MQLKRYLETLLHRCSDQAFGQDAVDHAIVTGAFPLTYVLDTDLAALFAPVGPPLSNCCAAPAVDALSGDSGRCARCGDGAHFAAETRYDQCVQTYQQVCRQHEEVLVDSYVRSGLLEELLRPVPLAA